MKKYFLSIVGYDVEETIKQKENKSEQSVLNQDKSSFSFTGTPEIPYSALYRDYQKEIARKQSSQRADSWNTYLDNNVAPFLEYNQAFYAKPEMDIRVGNFQSKTLGNVPIFAGGGASALPMALFSERRRALQDLLIASQKPVTQEEIEYTVPTAPEVDWRYKRQFGEQFMAGLNTIIEAVRPLGSTGFKLLQDDKTEIGRVNTRFLQDAQTIASEINGIVSAASHIEEKQNDKSYYVPNEAISAKNDVLGAAADIINGQLVFNDNKTIQQKHEDLKAWTSLTEIINANLENFENDMWVLFTNTLEDGVHDQFGQAVFDVDGNKLVTKGARDYIAKITKEGVLDERLKKFANSIAMTTSNIRAEDEDDVGQPFTEEQLYNHLRNALASKTDGILYGHGISVNVNVGDKPENKTSFINFTLSELESIKRSGTKSYGKAVVMWRKNHIAIYDGGAVLRIPHTDVNGQFKALGGILTQNSGYTNENLDHQFITFQNSQDMRSNWANIAQDSSGENFVFSLDPEKEKNLAHVSKRLFEYSDKGIVGPGGSVITSVTLGPGNEGIKTYSVNGKTGVFMSSNSITGTVKQGLLSKGIKLSTGGDWQFVDGLSYQLTDDKMNYKIMVGGKPLRQDNNLILVPRSTVEDIIFNEYDEIKSLYGEEVSTGGVQSNVPMPSSEGKKTTAVYMDQVVIDNVKKRIDANLINNWNAAGYDVEATINSALSTSGLNVVDQYDNKNTKENSITYTDLANHIIKIFQDTEE